LKLLILADFSKVLVCIANSHKTGRSTLHKLYGNPDNYAHKFGNDAFAKKLPIHLNWLHFRWYGYLHYLSIDYNVRKVHFSNDKDKRLEYGYFIHNISTRAHPHVAAPETNEVTATDITFNNSHVFSWFWRTVFSVNILLYVCTQLHYASSVIKMMMMMMITRPAHFDD